MKYRKVFTRDSSHISDDSLSKVINDSYTMCIASRFNPAWKECYPYFEMMESYCQDFLAKGVASKISKQMIKNIKKLTKVYFMINEGIYKEILLPLTYKRCLYKLNRLDEKELKPVEENSLQLVRRSDILLYDETEMISIRYMKKMMILYHIHIMILSS